MDVHYDIKAAEHWASLRSAATLKRGDPSIRELGDLDPDDIACYETQEPHMWTLTTASGDIEEITLSFQGVLRHRDLPPLKISKNIAQERIFTLRQAVDIMGLDTPAFQRSCKNLLAVQDYISRAISEDVTMIPWQPQIYKEGIAIRASNRYFTNKKSAREEPSVPFNDSTDPSNLFRSLDLEEFVHTKENQVDYYRCVTDDGHSKYIHATPSVFKMGDIVEAQIGIIAVPTKNGVMMLPKLRVLTLLSSEHTRAANLKKVESIIDTAIRRPEKRLRRRTGYDDTQDAEDGSSRVKQKTTNINQEMES